MRREPAVSDASASTSASSGPGSAARSPPTGSRSSTARPARRRASSCSSAASATCTPTSGSRWTSSTCRAIYGLVQGQGAQVVIGDGVGGGSNLYLAASLRAPRETFERRDHRPDDGADRRMWPAPISRADARSLLRARRGGAARAAPDLEPGREVGRPVGGDARTPPGTPATACRWRSTSTAASRRSGATPAASSRRRTRSSRTTCRRRRAGRRGAARTRRSS